MKSFLLLFIFCLLGVTYASKAQDYILSGLILDEQNKPVKRAVIQAVSNERIGYGKSDKDGLYYTTAIPVGKYEIIVVSDSNTYIAKLNINKGDSRKRFYNIKLVGKTGVITLTDKDPFMEVAGAKVRNSPDEQINAFEGREGRIPIKKSADDKKANEKDTKKDKKSR